MKTSSRSLCLQFLQCYQTQRSDLLDLAANHYTHIRTHTCTAISIDSTSWFHSVYFLHLFWNRTVGIKWHHGQPFLSSNQQCQCTESDWKHWSQTRKITGHWPHAFFIHCHSHEGKMAVKTRVSEWVVSYGTSAHYRLFSAINGE